MGLDTILRSGIALVDRATGSLQVTIVLSPWSGYGSYGEPTYGAPVLMQAIVDEKEGLRRLVNGQEVTQRAVVTIPRPITMHGAVDRREPIDPRDLLELPSGYIGPILDISGPTDPITRAPYMLEVVLG